MSNRSLGEYPSTIFPLRNALPGVIIALSDVHAFVLDVSEIWSVGWQTNQTSFGSNRIRDHPQRIRQQLERNGCRVLSVQEGKTGLSWLRETHLDHPSRFSPILTMPEVDGFAVLGYVQERGAELPVIIVTGEAGLSQRR